MFAFTIVGRPNLVMRVTNRREEALDVLVFLPKWPHGCVKPTTYIEYFVTTGRQGFLTIDESRLPDMTVVAINNTGYQVKVFAQMYRTCGADAKRFGDLLTGYLFTGKVLPPCKA